MADEEEREFASPPCSLGEVDPAYAGLDGAGGLNDWRKAERERLIALRMAIPASDRAELGERIAAYLEALIGDPAGLVVSAYWPFRGEPDLKPMLARLRERGAITALPVVVKKAHPLVFRQWQSGNRLERGVWNIPIPADGAEVVPDIAIAPVVGFDPLCYRLGYGGGFFDRTLAALLPHKPRLFGVGYNVQAIPTIYPQTYDIPMDAVVTEVGVTTA
ncbi:5-formyltetrahydrofolate cyclo-ligase [Erythrobacter sp. SG61-1L]|uniref:5-formyltetrahydrofolate cyclo-ligase n=1 Tax=Erythrobacter sp. SG61-1L TaxID=1603897 RepID=UPI0006C929BA|nr:5-formyltetrahydrofolate cyclo-ligase [Erythrobacter sp. SG61-1L]KPL67011.1 5-formyltetrahydrofolate cyclo-ligase [Erythrobacter sp. SG61-1L]